MVLRLLALTWMTPLMVVAVCACGGGDDDGGADGGDGGDDPCGFSSSDYLPYEVGFSWTFSKTDLGTGAKTSKGQALTEEMTHPDYGQVIVQVTQKTGGETVSLLRRENDRVIRFEQEDRDSAQNLDRTTTYDPGQIRIDESPERLAAGAEWDESYTEVKMDPQGVVLTTVPTTDHWKVLAVQEACSTAIGDFECVRVLKTRTQGGIAEKEFTFAPGVGKVREVGGNQLEELTACSVQ